MGAARYEILTSLPPGAGTRTRLAWQAGDVGFRRTVVLREVPEGAEVIAAAPAQEGVLPLLDLVELEGKRWAVYEFVPGATFAEVASAHFSVDRLPSLGLIGRAVVDACRAMHRVHSWSDPLGHVERQKHGGLSDTSVFLGFDGIGRVLDMNARRLGKFIAPELTRGEVFDARADVFSLGALLHHATTRFDKGYAVTLARAPSPAEFPPPSTIHPEATAELDAVVMTALMPSPGSRFASTLQLAEEIEKVLGLALFTHEQVSAVLLPLFGDRMTALKDLVDPKKRPPAPRPSAPRASAPPRASSSSLPALPRKTNNALDAMSAFDVKLDGGMIDDIDDLPTQANISLPPGLVRPGPPVPDFDPHATTPGKAQAKADFDPHATTPGRSMAEVAPRLANHPTDPQVPHPMARPSRPSGAKITVQDEAERRRARGQEKISTADIDPDQLSPELKALQGAFDDGEITEEPTNVRPRVSQIALAAFQPTPKLDPVESDDDYDDPKKKESTMDVDRPEPPSQVGPRPMGKAMKVLLGVFGVFVVGSALGVLLNLQKIRARLRPPPAPSTIQELPFEEVAFVEDAGTEEAPVEAIAAGADDAGELEEEDDGGEEEEEVATLSASDAGFHDGGAGKHTAQVQKKKKKKKRSR